MIKKNVKRHRPPWSETRIAKSFANLAQEPRVELIYSADLEFREPTFISSVCTAEVLGLLAPGDCNWLAGGAPSDRPCRNSGGSRALGTRKKNLLREGSARDSPEGRAFFFHLFVLLVFFWGPELRSPIPTECIQYPYGNTRVRWPTWRKKKTPQKKNTRSNGAFVRVAAKTKLPASRIIGGLPLPVQTSKTHESTIVRDIPWIRSPILE